jgi:hypothetical protein
MVLSPAYGRDYTKVADVLEAFLAGKDFILESLEGGTYANLEDLQRTQQREVKIYYSKKRKCCIVKVPYPPKEA